MTLIPKLMLSLVDNVINTLGNVFDIEFPGVDAIMSKVDEFISTPLKLFDTLKDKWVQFFDDIYLHYYNIVR